MIKQVRIIQLGLTVIKHKKLIEIISRKKNIIKKKII